jgi:hypothetical protein
MRQVPPKRQARHTHSKVAWIQVDVQDEDMARIEALAQALAVNDEASNRLRAEIERLLGGKVARFR